MRRRILTIVLVLTTATLVAQQTPASSTPRDLFERARMLDESNQKLPDAIALYEQAAAGAAKASQRELAATAHLRIGLLHKRLGQHADAERVLRGLIAAYGDQPDVARQAREQLPAPPSSASGQFTTRRVWSDLLTAPLGSPSPDGRFLSFVDWQTGDLALRDLSAATSRRLTSGALTGVPPAYAYGSRLSPDGRSVVFNWIRSDGATFELRRMSLDSSQASVLYRNDQLSYFDPFGWSQDGRFVLMLFTRLDRTNQIATVSTTDGTARVIKTLDWRTPGGMSFSPDGRWIAYDFRPREDARERDVYVLAVDGSREARIVDHPADDSVLGWAPDGRTVLFASDRTGSPGAWGVPVADGRAAGAPRLIRADLGARVIPLGFTRSGAFYYYASTAVSDVYTATIEVASGRIVAPAAPVTGRFVGESESADWSPDGRRLAVSTNTREPAGKQVLIKAANGGDERVMRTELTGVIWLRWSPDGRSILLSGRDRKNRRGVFALDPTSGAVKELFIPPASVILRPRSEWTADGKGIYYTAKTDDCLCVFRRELSTGTDAVVFRMPPGDRQVTLSASPDGRTLAVMTYDEAVRRPALRVVPAAGGSARLLYDAEDLRWFNVLAWTPDSKELLVGRSTGATIKVWRLPAGGGNPTATALEAEGLRDLRVAQDGGRVVFTAGVNRGDVWVMENFLPGATPAVDR